MYLKSIEMQGFKSFADKTKVVFDRGVTAVVGPNGSGKSNITESLRWALGESSAKSLRGGKMPDVIFAGTESRKPLNYASVIVTLDNQNGFIKDRGDEIKVERHIYRSGDSEYVIDGKKVRLRDIHDLFMDTGLGRDSFSIISQGRVEEIFNSKPEERRAIFEEAAGVLKYKTRKKETETKLAQTQDNLDRLEDIIYELDAQIAPLEKQAKTAKRFLELDEERKDLYLNVLVSQIIVGRAQLTEQENLLQATKAELTSYYEQRERLEQENQDLKAKRKELSDTVANEQAVLLELTKLMSDLEGKIEVCKLESSQNENSRKEAQERLQTLMEKNDSLSEQLTESQDSLAEKQAQLAEIVEELDNVKTEIAQFSEDPDIIIERLREQYVAVMQDEATTSNQLTKVKQDIQNQLDLVENQSQELAKLRADLEVSQTELASSQSELTVAEQNLRRLLDDYQAQELAVLQSEQAYRKGQSALFDRLDEMKSKRARQASLEAIQKNHSNFYAGVKAVLQQRQQLGGIIGAVSEQLTFDADMQTAIEIALGGASQNVIVEDEATARRAIAFLKQQRSGRATFLPLTTVKPRTIATHHLSHLRQAPGFLGTASSLVRYEERVGTIMENLLGAVAVFDTIEHANQAARATRFQVRMVTLDGSEIRPGGAFAGGANRNKSTTFVKPELDALTAELAKLSQTVAQSEQEVAQLKENLDQARAQLEVIKSDGEEARLAEQKVRLQHEQVAQRTNELELLAQAATSQSDQEVLTGLYEQQQELQATSAQLLTQKDDLSQQINSLKENREAVQERLQSLRERLSAAQLQETQVKSEMGFAKQNVTRLQGEKAGNEHEMELLNTVIQQKLDKVDTTAVEVLESQLADAQSKQATTNQQLIRLRFEVEDIQGQLEDVEEHIEHSRVKNEDLIRRQTRLESEVAQLSKNLQQLMADLVEQYKMTFDAAREAATVLDDLPEAERNLKELEKAIRALGPVSLDAIAQYDEVSQRLEFLSSQRQDVLSARDLLLSTINDMDDEVKERFKSSFDAIRASFQQTFRQMFGGGSADLILTDSDLLTTGVEISVQPPGKKIQSLNLMSGGEKALSALALLFSIIRVKTIPFVILDEVEAALDEANVKRFGDYLNRFDKSSQFIVVTHRKGTMAAADAIYGVTMQESGVSKVVSVKLKDLEEE